MDGSNKVVLIPMTTFDVNEFPKEETVVVFGSEAGTVRATGEPFRNDWCQKYVVNENPCCGLRPFARRSTDEHGVVPSVTENGNCVRTV
jgi:hypothetical protein